MAARFPTVVRRAAGRVRRAVSGSASAPAAPRRERLCVDLIDGVLTLRGRRSVPVAALEAVARGTGVTIAMPVLEPGPEFATEVDVSAFVDAADGTPETFELWMADAGGRHRQRVGNFEETSRPQRRLETQIAGTDVALDITDYGNLSVVVGRAAGPRLSLETLEMEQHGDELAIGLVVTSARDAITDARIRFRGRNTERIVERPLRLEPDEAATRSALGRLVYRLTGRVEVEAIVGEIPASEEFVDASIIVTPALGGEQTLRVPAPTDVARGRGRALVARVAGAAEVLVPYATARIAHLSYAREQFDADDYDYMMRGARRWPLWSAVRWVRPVWLIGETPYKAQDNGMHMFRYIRTQHPRRRAYYVIDADSPDVGKVADLGNVVTHHSREHIRLALRASRFAGSHHAEYLYPSRDPRVVTAMRGVRIFLRHGVTAMKNMKYVYGREVRNPRPAERYVVASERERRIIVEDYGYRPSQVVVSGFARFDALLTDPPAPDPTVLVMPTWRGDLMREEAFLSSEYFIQWRGFLLSERLRRTLTEHGATVTLLLHPNMRKYAAHFDDPLIHQVHVGEADVQELLRKSAMLVTDMSSVAWDFSFLRRPVAFFLFDLERMTRNREAHIDVHTELPGPAVASVDDLCDVVERTVRAGFAMSDEDYAKARAFLAHDDRRNRERVYRVIATAWRPSTALDRVRDWRRARVAASD